MGLETLQICARQVGTGKAVLFLRVHTWGQGHWGCVGQILNCDLASGEPEVTTGLIF